MGKHPWQHEHNFIDVPEPSAGESQMSNSNGVETSGQYAKAFGTPHGTLKEVLEDAGYRRVRGEWRGPAWSGTEQRSVLAEV